MKNAPIEMQLAGEYNLLIAKPDGTVHETGWFKNIILDVGLDALLATTQIASPLLARARVGTGTSTPVGSQTQLDAQLAASSQANGPISVINEGSPSYGTTHSFSYAFAQGAVVGNVTEVGVGWDLTGATLFSRALIVDNVGTPVTITLASIDQLTVFYRLRLVPPITDTTGSLVIGGVTYNYTARLAKAATFCTANYAFHPSARSENLFITEPVLFDYQGAGTYDAGTTLAAITGVPSGTNSNGYALAVVLGSYTPSSFYRDDVWTWGPASGNAVGGIQVLTLGYLRNNGGNIVFQYQFDNPIPKTITTALSIPVRISLARA